MVKKRRPDPTNESPAYWEQILKERGLDMDAGRDHHGKLKYVGSSNDILIVEEVTIRGRSGRVRPSGAPPDTVE